MSSARKIVEGAGSLWADVVPLLPSYVRRVNLGEYDRLYKPLNSETLPRRHFLINDTAADLVASKALDIKPTVGQLWDAVEGRWKRRFPTYEPLSFSRTDEELSEAVEIARRLINLIESVDAKNLAYNVVHAGIGRLETVEIDLDGSNIIGEIKAGDRPFRSIDFRQLLLAVVVIGEDAIGRDLVLINPREGISWRCNVSEFVETVSMSPVGEFIEQVRYYLSDAGISA